MGSIYEILEEVKRSEETSVMATVIKVEGSAYRKEGTTMLFMKSGRQVGIISGGCLETDLAIQAENLLNNDSINSKTIIYDMSSEDDMSWGRGAGCNGKVHILVEKVDFEYRKQLGALQEHLQKGIPVISIKIVKGNPSTVGRVFIAKDKNVFGHKELFSEQLINQAQKAEKFVVHEEKDLEAFIYIHHFHPRPRLFIFGAGPDVIPVFLLAKKAGFSVTIWDWRPNHLKQGLFPKNSLRSDTSITKAVEEVNFHSTDSVIIMTHDFLKDKELLQALLKYQYQQLTYFGILGPRKRTSRLLNGAPIPKYLHSPIGMDIGAEGPEEIAISIVADLVRMKRKRNKKGGSFSFEERSNSWYLSSSRGK